VIKTRIASTAAVFTFGLAAIGGTVLTVAAPANAAPNASDPTVSSRESNKVAPVIHELFPVTPSGTSHRFEPSEHRMFPTEAAPHSDHLGHGHKGLNEPVAPDKGIRDMFPSVSAKSDEIGPSSASNKSRPVKHELFPVQHGDV
jgi:hypothetical protein